MTRYITRTSSTRAPWATRIPRKNAMPLVPGEVATLRFELFTTSVRLKAGHRIRLALAGADRPLMGLYPPGAAPTWTVHRSGDRASFLEVPMMELTP